MKNETAFEENEGNIFIIETEAVSKSD